MPKQIRQPITGDPSIAGGQGGVGPPSVDPLQTTDFNIQVLTQESQPPSQKWAVVLGWRPSLVMVVSNQAAAAGGVIVQADDLNTVANDADAGVKVTGANPVVAQDAVTITDFGYVLGEHALIKDPNARLVVLAFKGTGQKSTTALSSSLKEFDGDPADADPTDPTDLGPYGASQSRNADGTPGELTGTAFQFMTPGVYKWTG